MFSDGAQWIPSNNFTWGRSAPIRYIVLHTIQGSGLSGINTFKSKTSGVSAHYIIMEDGEIVCMVEEEHTAWHAGRISGQPTTEHWTGINPNAESIGIEFAGYAAAPLGPQQVRSAVALIRELRGRYGPLPLVAHAELSPGDRSDPGWYNMDWVKREVGGDDDMWDSDHNEAAKAFLREFMTTPEGANLVEFAVSRPGGFGDKLAEALGRRMEEAVRDAMAEALSS